MSGKLDRLLEQIDDGRIPPMILVGGDNDYLVQHAWSELRERILAFDGTIQVEHWEETSDLGAVLDSYRTHSLFGGRRLLVLPEVNAFIGAGELDRLVGKALDDWRTAKSERKRSSSLAKLLHAIGLVGLDLEAGISVIASTLGLEEDDATLGEMIPIARERGATVSRGEGDAALLTEAAIEGGAPGATLLMKTADVPEGSATVEAIAKQGAVVVRNLGRNEFQSAMDEAVREIGRDYDVRFDASAISTLRARLGVDRILQDKRSKEIPDLRGFVAELVKLAGFAGRGGEIDHAIVERQVEVLGGGMRWEFASLVAEGKVVEAVEKLRDLVAQTRRQEPRSAIDFLFGRYLFSLADELRQALAAASWCRMNGVDLRRPMHYNQFRNSVASPLGEYLAEYGLARKNLHPFALYKKYESACRYGERRLIEALSRLDELEFERKSGGIGAQLGLESLVLSLR